MKKIYCLCLACLLVSVMAAQSVKELYIFHTNDMHSRIEPFASYFPDTVLAGKAGVLRRAAFVKEQRREHKDMLLFDSGDFSQGSPYYNLFKGEVEIKMFDFGLDNMARLFKMANFPIVCANYDVTGTVLEGLVKEYTVIERDGIRIGVFGLGPELDGLVAHANYGNVKIEDPVSEGQRVADLLKNQEHCDLVICLSHLGWKGEPYSDIELIENTRNIDIVLGGHSHSFFEVPEFYKNLDGIEVPVQQMGKSAAFVGRMVVKMQKN